MSAKSSVAAPWWHGPGTGVVVKSTGSRRILDLEDHVQMVAWMLTRFARHEPPR